MVAELIASADSIDDRDVLRHGGIGKVFTGVRAPSTVGTFLRVFSLRPVRQLDAVAPRTLQRLAAVSPRLLAGTESMAFVDIDDTIREVHGYQTQGARTATELSPPGDTTGSSPTPPCTVAADETHRAHAVIEQLIAELQNRPMTHAQSGKFTANDAWLALTCLAFNVLRAAGAAASARHDQPSGPPCAPTSSKSQPGSRLRPGDCPAPPTNWPLRPRGKTCGLPVFPGLPLGVAPWGRVAGVVRVPSPWLHDDISRRDEESPVDNVNSSARNCRRWIKAAPT